MTMTDPNQRTLRQFQCRDYLWETFEQMSAELECSVDYLINEAMRQYARSRDRGGPLAEMPEPMESAGGAQQQAAMFGAPPPMPGGRPAPPMRPGGPPAMPGMPTGRMPPQAGMGPPPGMQARPGGPQGGPMIPPMQQPGMRGPSAPGMGPPQAGPGAPPRIPSMGGNMGGAMGAPPPVRPPGGAPPMIAQPGRAPGPPPMAPPPMRGMPGGPPPMAQPPQQPMGRMQSGPPMVGGPPPIGRAPSGGGTLVAVYEGQQYPVTKEEFIIGRGQKTSDLTIRDSNVSRRHAAVVLYNGQYWIVDQQSTNGVEYNGQKVDKKLIEDGDSYRICDHEIRFMYR